MRDATYRALQAAVAALGGADELAERMGTTRSDTYARLSRTDGEKGLMRAFIDFLPFIFRDPKASLVWATETNKLMDIEPPVQRRHATYEDVGRAWLESIKRMPEPYRTAAIAELAHQLGMRVEDLKL